MPAHPSPLALYIHWPFCKSKCPYCDFNSHVRERVDQERWRKALISELEYMAARKQDARLASIFFGGGTPSLMPPATAQALIDRAQTLWPVADDLEITLEANPTSVETGTFADFKQAGVNRVSLGVQSLDETQLKFLGREHSSREALHAIEQARTQFARYSFDLIYARPQQTLKEWEAELTQALRHAGDHLSLYQLTIEENTAFAHAYAKGGFTMPDEAQAEALYRLTEDIMAAQGLPSYEVSNYARPGQESRHNLAYWQGMDYIGVGPGAHGRLTQSGKRIATSTLKSPERWLENVEKNGHAVELWEAVDVQQEIAERLMMGLRLTDGIDYARFKATSGHELRDYLDAQKCAFYISKGLLADNKLALQATLTGRLVLNSLLAGLLR
jgi:oxygen-independent coproporphyrinogen-3 oxidase